jgi:hypothetical protein
MITVFQIQLTNFHRDQINENGWNGTPFGSVYLDLTDGGYKKNILELIIKANEFGLVAHTLTLDTDDFDEAFELGNGHGDGDKIKHHQKHKSVSVGDIFIRNHKDGAVVDSFGFIELCEKQAATIEVFVVQVMENT